MFLCCMFGIFLCSLELFFSSLQGLFFLNTFQSCFDLQTSLRSSVIESPWFPSLLILRFCKLPLCPLLSTLTGLCPPHMWFSNIWWSKSTMTTESEQEAVCTQAVLKDDSLPVTFFASCIFSFFFWTSEILRRRQSWKVEAWLLAVGNHRVHALEESCSLWIRIKVYLISPSLPSTMTGIFFSFHLNSPSPGNKQVDWG